MPGELFLAGCWSGYMMFHMFHVWDCWVSICRFFAAVLVGTFQFPGQEPGFYRKKKAQLPRFGVQDPRSVDHRWKPALSSTVCRIGL